MPDASWASEINLGPKIILSGYLCTERKNCGNGEGSDYQDYKLGSLLHESATGTTYTESHECYYDGSRPCKKEYICTLGLNFFF